MTTINQNEEFDLFATLDPEEQAELGWEKTEETIAATSIKKAKPVTKPATEVEPDEYPIDRVVFYAGHRMAVPSRTMKKEEVRAWLEETFPELSKENTEMIYDEKTGHLVPVLKGHKKGAIDMRHETEPVAVSAKPLMVYPHHAEPGLPRFFRIDYTGRVEEVRDTQAGRFILPLQSGMEAHLGATPVGGFIKKENLPWPSVDLLKEIVDRFVAEPEIEHLAYVVWDNDHYEVVWPRQIANRVSVVGEGIVETENRFIFLQIHSHGRLDAFFSGTDDQDEVRTGLYGVIGNIGRGNLGNIPHASFRMSVGGRFNDLTIAPFQGDVEGVVFVR